MGGCGEGSVNNFGGGGGGSINNFGGGGGDRGMNVLVDKNKTTAAGGKKPHSWDEFQRRKRKTSIWSQGELRQAIEQQQFAATFSIKDALRRLNGFQFLRSKRNPSSSSSSSSFSATSLPSSSPPDSS